MPHEPQEHVPLTEPECPPVFIHSMFRAGSTYLFSVFRRSPCGYWCYQEPEHELLRFLDTAPGRLLEIGNEVAKALRHPNLERPYFWEFYQVKDALHGLFKTSFSYRDFFIPVPPGLPEDQAKYFRALINHARGQPVFQCCRTFGRVAALKKAFGGIHIHLWREPRSQWWSYKVNDYFDATIQLIFNSRHLPGVLAEAKRKCGIPEIHDEEIERELEKAHGYRLSFQGNYFAFYTLWLYAFLECEAQSNVSIGIDRLSRDKKYQHHILEQLAELQIRGLDFSDCSIPYTTATTDDARFFEELEESVVALFVRHGYKEDKIRKVLDLQREAARFGNEAGADPYRDLLHARELIRRYMDHAHELSRRLSQVQARAAWLDNRLAELRREGHVAGGQARELQLPGEALEENHQPGRLPGKEGGHGLVGAFAGSRRKQSTTKSHPVGPQSFKPRLAYLSPVPPARSGIADYSMELLPELARYYEIELVVDQPEVSEPWLVASFPIRTVDWFKKHADRYDRILYHFGNSELHKHMFELLLKHPGIIVLHDFYLSNVLHWMDHTGYAPGIFRRELYRSHGHPALAELAEKGEEAAVWRYPCNRVVLDAAHGVIVHSRYAMELADEWYGKGTAQDWHLIPQPVKPVSVVGRAVARARLGLDDSDFLVCSFGFVNSVKLPELLLGGWLASRLARDHRCRLVFVGSVSDELEAKLKNQADLAGVSDRVLITGYVPRSLYETYLAAADIAVQLRARSRGETARSVLDCLAWGLPTVITGLGWPAEVPDDVALKLPEQVCAQDVASALEGLREDPALRHRLAEAGRTYIQKLCAPSQVAEQYFQAIEGFARKRNRPPSLTKQPSTHHLVPQQVGIRWGAPILNFSGYARLSRQILLALDRLGISLAIEPFSTDKEFLRGLAPDEIRRWQRLLQSRVEEGVYVCFHPPTLWDRTDFFLLSRQRNRGFNAYVGITMFETDGLPAGWAEACNGMDQIWVPSTFNRETFIRAGVHPDRIRVIPIGLDLSEYDPAHTRPMKVPGRRGFTFLSVFQWTQRKGWDVLLKAYLAAFSPQDDVCLVLRTYPGYKQTPPIRERVDNYIRQLGYDPQCAPPIILLEDFIPDKDMPGLYAAADAFVLPTRGEGWGIPFMEAMAMGLTVIATRWSAHLDFMNDDNSYLINIDGMVPVPREQTEENPYYTPDQRWAEPSVAHTAVLMRYVFEHRKEAKTKAERARQDIIRHWSIERTAQWILERVSELSAKARNKQNVSALPVLWEAPIFDPSGYAEEARNFIRHVSKSWPLRVQCIGRTSAAFLGQMNPDERKALAELVDRPVGEQFIQVTHAPAYAFRKDERAVYAVGRTMFETDSLPEDWITRCNAMDEIWVPTAFNVETFRRAGVTVPVYVIPEGVDWSFFRPGLLPLPIQGRRRFAFLSVFEWTYRKGWDLLLRAWAAAFAPDEDVCLVLRAYLPSAPDSDATQAAIEDRVDRFLLEDLGLSRSDVAPIIVLGKHLSPADMPRLYNATDVYVMPSRGEGWGRPYIEAMACALPVIGTRWSGQLAFMNDKNAYLIDIEGLEEVDKRMEFAHYRGQRWAKPSVEHLVQLMRHVYRHPDEARAKGARARQDVVEKWGWERAAEQVVRRLRAITAGLAAKRLGLSTGRTTIRWEGSQFVHHSLALVNRELSLQLIRAGHEVSIVPYEPHQFGPEVDDRFSRLAERFMAALSRPADVHVRHQWPPNLAPPEEGHWVIIQPWEFGTIPKRWVEVMTTQVDEVWVPSHYVRYCYMLSGVPADRVYVVPNGVDPERFHPGAPPLDLSSFNAPDKRFRFLFVGGTILRKGIDILLQAYSKAFTRDDDVCLVIKDMGNRTFYRGQTWEQVIRELQGAPDAPAIVYLEQDLSPTELPGLYTACHCLVHPYRGEGFGLPIAEAMACGLPVIVTGYGAAMDFCDGETAYLIPAVVRKRTDPGLMAQEPAGSLWLAEPDVDALARLMRHVYEHREEARARGLKASQRIRSRFTWERAAETAMARIRALREQPIRRYQQIANTPMDHAIPQRSLTLVESRSVHLLMMPDWHDPEDRWQEAIRAFLAEFGPNEDVGLIIRVDPLEVPDQEGLLQRIQRWGDSEGLNLDAGPLVLILNDLVDPTRRDLIYATAQVLVELSDSARGRTIRSEAAAHGLIICRPNGSDMRRAWRAVRETHMTEGFTRGA